MRNMEAYNERVVITNDIRKRRVAMQIRGSVYEPGVGYTIDPMADLTATRAAIQAFPDLEGRLPQRVLDSIRDQLDVRPPDVATAWAGDRTADELLPRVPEGIRSKLYRYQQIDLAFAAARIKASGGAYNAWDRGLGKTLYTIAMLYELDVQRAVVVTPNSSKETVWRPEFIKWDLGGLFSDRIFNLNGDAKKRTQIFQDWMDEGGVLLIHYEALRLIEFWPSVDIVVCDEAHRLANGAAGGRGVPAFYKALKKIPATYRLALSGSVIVNSPEDVFGAAHWLYPQNYRSKWKDWNDRFFDYAETGFGKKLIGVKRSMLDQMRQELAGWMTVRYKTDELKGLPEKIVQDLYVDLSPAQRKVYDDLAKNFIAELPNDDIIMAPNVLSQLGKLRQIACGLDLLGESMQDSAKIDLTAQLVQDNLPHKTVVFCWHRATVEAISARLTQMGIECATVSGDTPLKKRVERVKMFQEDEACKVIVATIKTLGESVTLHAAADLIFVESSWTPADMDQAADRVYRIGQERRVTITNILARDTVDEFRVLPILKNKEALRSAVLGRQ